MFPAFGGSRGSNYSKYKRESNEKLEDAKEEGEADEVDSKPLFSIDKSGSGNKDDYLVTIDSSDDILESGEERESGEIPKKRHKSKKSHEHRRRFDKGRKRSRSRSSERRRPYNDYDRQSSSRSNQFSHQERSSRSGYDNRHDYDKHRGRDRDRDLERDHGRDRWRNNYRGNANPQEEYRLRVSQQFPKKVFLEEVELQPEFAFRVDTNATQSNLTFRSLSVYQTPSYHSDRRNVLGATSEDLNKIFRFQPKFHCVPPPGLEEADDSEATNEDVATKRQKVSTESATPVEFFSISKKNKPINNANSNSRFNINHDFESYSFSRKDGDMGIKDKIEYYNSQVRKEPQNIQLWREFALFQDQVFEESDQIFDGNSATTSKKGGKKRNRKALIEKKIAILEKAIEANPKSLELHMDRMGYLCEIYKPRFVLTEWKKLVSTYQQISSFWIEYLRFASTQLQLFSHNSIVDVFSKCFQKFKQMLSPSYSDFQRPEKFLLLMADIFLSVTLILKNSGYTERAIALHQGKLEIDFNCPLDLLKDKTKQDWKEVADLFELFWNTGTLRFGENGALGWSSWIKNKSKSQTLIGLPESKVSDFEDQFFESIAESEIEATKAKNWTFIESCRSKLLWIPFRDACSDVDGCDDSNRIVLAEDIIPYLYAIPSSLVSSFEIQSCHFRHVINFLLLLREDFLPSTHTLDSLLPAFVSISMSNCQSLFDEVFYWQKYLDLYHCSGFDLNSTIPEGFILAESTVPTHHNTTASKKLILDTNRFSDEVEKIKEDILLENYSNYNDILRNVVEKSVDSLEQPFATLLVEIFFHFEQKSCRSNTKNRKSQMKFAKSLLKKDKLRNSTTLYREMALIEYFNGNTAKCVDLLVKTINTANKAFDGEEMDIEANWEQSTELIRLYRQLAEFYVIENDQLALNILASIGNNFQSINLEEMKNKDSKPNRNFLMKAKRKFEKIVNKVFSEDNDGSLIQNRYDGEKCIEFLLQKANFIVEWTCAYGLFEFLLNGFEKTCKIFTTVLNGLPKGEPLTRSTKYNPAIVNLHHMREQIYVAWCKIGARALSKNLMINSKFRQVLGQALEEYPSSPPLLLLFTDVEKQSSIAGKLWRLMVSIIKQESPNVSIRWAPLFMGFGLARRIEEIERDEEIGLDTFGLGGPAVPLDTIFYKLDSLLCAAESNVATRNCPLIWRVHLKLLAMRAKQGKDVQRARSVLYDAIRHCPSLKVIYLDGVTYFPEMMQEMIDLMSEKQLLVRLPTQELDVLLEIEGEAKIEKEEVNNKVKSSKNETIEISDGEVSD